MRGNHTRKGVADFLGGFVFRKSFDKEQRINQFHPKHRSPFAILYEERGFLGGDYIYFCNHAFGVSRKNRLKGCFFDRG